MVVKHIKLGQYTGLEIDPSLIVIDEESVDAYFAQMLVDQVIDDENLCSEEAFRDKLREKIFNESLINRVMRDVLDKVAIEYNEDALSKELQLMMSDIEDQAKALGFTLEFYCDYNNIGSLQDLKVMLEKEIRTSYLEIATLETIADKEGIHVSKAQLNQVKEIYQSTHNGQPEDALAFEKSVLIQETVKWLVVNNTRTST